MDATQPPDFVYDDEPPSSSGEGTGGTSNSAAASESKIAAHLPQPSGRDGDDSSPKDETEVLAGTGASVIKAPPSSRTLVQAPSSRSLTMGKFSMANKSLRSLGTHRPDFDEVFNQSQSDEDDTIGVGWGDNKPGRRGSRWVVIGSVGLFAIVFGASVLWSKGVISYGQETNGDRSVGVVGVTTKGVEEAADFGEVEEDEAVWPAYLDEEEYPLYVHEERPDEDEEEDWTDFAYEHAFPAALWDLGESILPPRWDGGTRDIPMLMHVPAIDVTQAYWWTCFAKVEASENGQGDIWEDQPLEVVHDNDQMIINVDLSTEHGIDRAASLELASSGLADIISFSLLHYGADALFSPGHSGRMFIMVRHPIDRAVASFYQLKETQPDLAGSMTLEEYSFSEYAEDEWLTRQLSGRTTGEVTEKHAQLAMEVLRRKAMVGLYEEMRESLDRMAIYFGWGAPDGDLEELGRCRDLAAAQERILEREEAQTHGTGTKLRDGDLAYFALMNLNKWDLKVYAFARHLYMLQADFPAPVVVDAEATTEEASITYEARNCLENGNFEGEPAISNWYTLRSGWEVAEGSNPHHRALKVHNRAHQMYGGLWQNFHFPNDCLLVGHWFEIKATVSPILMDSGKPFACDPTLMFIGAESCPTISLRLGDNLDLVAYTRGPLQVNDAWHEIYGLIRITPEMVLNRISIVVSGSPPPVDIIIENVSMTRAPLDSPEGLPDCENLVMNGGAEYGDHRGWFIRGDGGKGRGSIQIISPGPNHSQYAFRHGGGRDARYRGMLQTIDPSCLTEGTTWKIYATFRYFTFDAKHQMQFKACRKINPRAQNSCPVFAVDFRRKDGTGLITTGPLKNEVPGDFVKGGWSDIEHNFTVTAEMALLPDVWLYVTSVAPGVNYDLDNVRLVPA